ncbi:dihydrodipicolinate synthase family protein [Aeoliella sp.]|uniref:dihydrodipicolinate synthase family protein n=1 Tax=Aeoliella sp. TaxID=2795800 RepID=UPI003CCB7EE6
MRVDSRHATTEQLRLIPATYAPLGADGSVDLKAIPKYASYLLERGIRDVFINGTTGESLSLTTDERLKIAEVWGNHASELNIIVHTGHNCLPDAVALSSHAKSVGAVAISAMAPSFLRPQTTEDLLEFLAHLASAAPQLPFYYYHIPSLTHVPLEVDSFLQRAIDKIPSFAGIKFTHEDLGEFAQCNQKWGSRLELMFGRDELLLPALAIGARSAVGSFYNIIPEVFFAIEERLSHQDMEGANQWMLYALRYIDLCKQVGVAPAGKWLMSERGVCGPTLRLPLVSLDQSQQEWLREEIQRLPMPGASSERKDTPVRTPHSQPSRSGQGNQSPESIAGER